MRLILPILLGTILFASKVNAQISGNALSFDGSDDYITCPLPSIFNSIGSNDFTIELWVLPELSSFQRLFFAQQDADNYACISLNSANEVVFYLQENGINHSVQSTNIVANSFWKHIAVTWNSTSQEAKIYLSGDEVSYSAGVFVSSTGNDNTMTIGSRTDGGQMFNGKIDELSVWDYTKLGCEIEFEHNDKKMGAESGLATYYNFDHGTAAGWNFGVDTLIDITGNLNNGILNNFALSGSNSNWIVSPPSMISKWFGDPSTVHPNGTLLSATLDAFQYQWIDCSNNTDVMGAVDWNFNPTTDDPNYNGGISYYAVVSTKGTCVDTSECFEYSVSSIIENTLESKAWVYPNPSNGVFTIDLPTDAEEVQILSLNGKLINRFIPNGEKSLQIDRPDLNGMYLVIVKTQSSIISTKISIQNN